MSITLEPKKKPVAYKIKTGSVLIEDGTLLPTGVQFESEPYAPGWRLVKDLDGYGLDRAIRAARWNFFCLAGEIEATVFGLDEEKMVRRAIERILANPKTKTFNSLEITRVTSVGSERFPVIHYLTVSAHSRHFQESLILSSAKSPQNVAPTKVIDRSIAALQHDKEPSLEAVAAQLDAATTLRL
jgi:hypothetical protein